MIFRQFFDPVSSTYTYLLAERSGGEALIIDPVKDRAEQYAELTRELDLKLVMAVDTHIHADHVTALGDLRESTGCVTAMGEMTKAECVAVRFREGKGCALMGSASTCSTPRVTRTTATASRCRIASSPAIPC